jgi:hypothetical protein
MKFDCKEPPVNPRCGQPDPTIPKIHVRVRGAGRPTGTSEELADQRRVEFKTIIEMLIRGASKVKIAKWMNISTFTLNKWIKSPEFQLRYAKARAELFGDHAPHVHIRAAEAIVDIEKLIAQYAEKAVQKIYRMMEDQTAPQALQLKAAQDLADRSTKTSKTKKVQQAHVHTIISPEDLAAIAQTAREIQLIGKPIGVDEITLDPNFQLPEHEEETAGD